MSQGTLDNAPPPFFRQGPSALSKLSFFAALALFLMIADTRLQITRPLRGALAVVLHPVQRALLAPVQVWRDVGEYFIGLEGALARAEAARLELAAQAARALRVEQLEAENARLRSLIDLGPRLSVRSQPAQILYAASDPYTRKVIIDRGSRQGVALASPVINEHGVLGQVTRVYPLSSEVTLLTDKDAAIPVLNARSQVKSAAFGGLAGLELRFVAGNADVQVGDQLLTTGVDGVYPPGLPVATVALVDRKAESGFARIALRPAVVPDGVRHVLVLEPVGAQMPPRPDSTPTDSVATKGRKGARK
ncbi:MAG: rod shape-determining protein MreC [Burkholderiaceae bacterium]